MRKTLTFLVGTAAALLAGAALAQTAMTNAEVTKIDKANGRVTLRHEEIKSLDMPPMTMAFHVRDRNALDTLAVGDKVRFAAERIEGKYTVTQISKGP